MNRYIIGSYFELYFTQPTPHEEQIIEAESLEDARGIAAAKYGWGAWATRAADDAPLGPISQYESKKYYYEGD